MIKKSLRAYITRRQLIFLILPDGEMVGLAYLQTLEHLIYGVLKILIVLPHLHGVQELDQRGEILLLLRGFIVDVADQRRVEQRFGLQPKIVAGFAVALSVGNEGVHQLQNVLLTVDVRER